MITSRFNAQKPARKNLAQIFLTEKPIGAKKTGNKDEKLKTMKGK